MVLHLGKEWIVGIAEDGAIVGKEVVVEFLFGALHALKRAKPFQMRTTDIGDESVVGFCDIHKFLDVARVRSSHLHDCKLVRTRDL